ncbi:MAG: hypothetical protein ACD_22C00181G0001, partial [uncultured bacterium]
IDLQKTFTDKNEYLATQIFEDEVSATPEKLTEIANFAKACQAKGYKVITTKLIHDLKKMFRYDKKRLLNQINKGLIEVSGEGIKPVVGTKEDAVFDFGSSTFIPNPELIFEKCSRSILKDPQINDYLAKHTFSNIILTGIDTNICIYESARDLLATKSFKHVIICTDLVSARGSEEKDAKNKLLELEQLGAIICLSNQLNLQTTA